VQLGGDKKGDGMTNAQIQSVCSTAVIVLSVLAAFAGAGSAFFGKKAKADETNLAYEVADPRLKNVIGQALGMLQQLFKAADMPFDVDESFDPLTREQLEAACKRVNPNSSAPIIVGGNAASGFVNGTWIFYLHYWRTRSKKFTDEALEVSQYLRAEHLVSLAKIGQCSYFWMLDTSIDRPPSGNSDLSFLAGPMWEYVELVKKLKSQVPWTRLNSSSSQP
jgi:hypothetical protein